MSGENNNGNGEAFLFNSTQMRWLGPQPKSVLTLQPDADEPWLKPVWRLANGEYTYVRYIRIIHRTFAREFVYERTFLYAGQPCIAFNDDRGKILTGHRIEALRHYLEHGWTKPKEMSHVKLAGTCSEERIYDAVVYCDDLFLCPSCGTFHGEIGSFMYDYEPLRDGDRIKMSALNKFLEENRNRPEFRMLECKKGCCKEHRARIEEEISKRREIAAINAREAFFNAQLLPKWTAISVATPWEYCNPILQQPQSIGNAAQFPRKKPQWVYVIGGEGRFKIGIATNVQKRLRALQTSSPFRLILINEWEHSEARNMEYILHNKYMSSNTSGEWFALTPDQILKIRIAHKIEDLFGDVEFQLLRQYGENIVEL